MADINQFREKVGSALSQATESIKELDMGVALTKAEDAISGLDLDGKKKQIADFLDSPKMDEIRSAGRTVRDFLGYVPNYVQSIPGMVRDRVEKLRKK